MTEFFTTPGMSGFLLGTFLTGITLIITELS
jgi:hypothetical protein